MLSLLKILLAPIVDALDIDPSTYMIDIISFIQQVCYIINKDLLFDEEYRKPVVINTKTTDRD